MKLNNLENIRQLEAYLLKDIHGKSFDIKEGDDLSIVLADLVRWVVTDPKYGLMANVNQSIKQKDAMLEVISLYEEWIKTGVKPSIDRWNQSQLKVNTDNSLSLADFYGYVTETVSRKGIIPKLDILQAQYDHIQDSIYKYSNSALFTFNDYEKDL